MHYLVFPEQKRPLLSFFRRVRWAIGDRIIPETDGLQVPKKRILGLWVLSYYSYPMDYVIMGPVGMVTKAIYSGVPHSKSPESTGTGQAIGPDTGLKAGLGTSSGDLRVAFVQTQNYSESVCQQGQDSNCMVGWTPILSFRE
jgi:hypothetical protein